MTHAAFDRFMTEFMQSWATQDLDRMVAAFAPDATYADTPFNPVNRGREGIRRYNEIVLTQRDGRAGYEILSFDEATGQGIANWWIEYTVKPRSEWRGMSGDPAASFAALGLDPDKGNHLRQNGIAVARIGPDGLATEFREWWHTEKGEAGS